MTLRRSAVFALSASLIALTGVALTGCSDRTQQAASNTMDSAAQDTQNHVEATGKAVEKTGENVAEAGKDVAHDTKMAAKETGQAVKNGADYAGEAVGGAVKGADKAVGNAGKAMTITPAVKNALIKSKLDASTINVDTESEANTVVLNGTVKSAAQRTQAAQIAMQAIKDAGERFRVKNELTVAP
jgi:osmotically-inducible protein OsmY